MSAEKSDIVIVGGGPAGLRAAEIVSAAGRRTVVADHKPSVGRKFLVAGRGGLNLTHSEPVENFPARYNDATGLWSKLLADFSPDDLRAWAKDLGIETFVGTSGRVFPTTKQAAPLLRRWIERLRKQGVSFRARHALVGFQRAPDGGWIVNFKTATETTAIEARAVVFALGGASWPQTGSDGAWVNIFAKAGIKITPLAPANCGWEVDWPAELLAEAEGQPLKNVVVRAGAESVAGELLITKYGLEGGALYQLGRTLRAMKAPVITIDLKPSFSVEQLVQKLGTTGHRKVCAITPSVFGGWDRLLPRCFSPTSHRARRSNWPLVRRITRSSCAAPGPLRKQSQRWAAWAGRNWTTSLCSSRIRAFSARER